MLTQEEQEVSVLIEPGSGNAKIYATFPAFIRKFDKLCEDNPEEWKCTGVSRVDGEEIGKSYECKRNLVSFRAKSQTRELTEEQRAEYSKRMKRLRDEQLHRIHSAV